MVIAFECIIYIFRTETIGIKTNVPTVFTIKLETAKSLDCLFIAKLNIKPDIVEPIFEPNTIRKDVLSDIILIDAICCVKAIIVLDDCKIKVVIKPPNKLIIELLLKCLKYLIKLIEFFKGINASFRPFIPKNKKDIYIITIP